jgi:hypothetical protein
MIQNTKVQVYASASGVSVTKRTPLLQAPTKVERVCMSWGYSCRTVIQRVAPCMSTAIIRAEEICLSFISEGDEEFRSLVLMSAGEGRAEIRR